MGPNLSPTPKISELFSGTDWIVFSIILLVTVLMALIAKRVLKSSKNEWLDYLIMGRQLTLPFFVGTLVATWYGGIFGVTAIAFDNGIYNFVTQGVFWYITYLFFAIFMVQKIKASNAVTLPELVGNLFGPKSQKLATFFNFFNVLPISYIISIGLFFQLFLPIELWQAMALGLVCVLGYSTYAGFRAIVFSDMVQFLVMCASVALVILFSYHNFGGIDFLKTNLSNSYFSLTGNHPISTTLVWGFIALSTLVDPNFYQRVFAAKTKKTAQKGILISTVIWILFDLCTTFGAMYAKAVIPTAESSKAYMFYSLQLLPSPLKGFFLAGIMATILSTLDSYLFLSGTTVSYDFLGQRKKVFSHTMSVILTGVFALLLALTFDGNVKAVWKTLGSYSAACFLIPVMWGQFSKSKISDSVFVISSLSGALTMTLWKWTPISEKFSTIDDFYIGALTTFVFLIIGKRSFVSTKKS